MKKRIAIGMMMFMTTSAFAQGLDLDKLQSTFTADRASELCKVEITGDSIIVTDIEYADESQNEVTSYVKNWFYTDNLNSVILEQMGSKTTGKVTITEDSPSFGPMKAVLKFKEGKLVHASATATRNGDWFSTTARCTLD